MNVKANDKGKGRNAAGGFGKRRKILAALGAGLAMPRLALSQAAKTLPATVTVAVLFPGESDDDEISAKAFFEQMARFGWVEGKNVVYDRHSGKGTRQYLATMASLAAGREPNLIYATNATLAKAVLDETSALPVVFTTVNNPVASGLVSADGKPSRNGTGTYQSSVDPSPRRYELIRQMLPQVKRIGAVFDRGAPGIQQRRVIHEKSARAVGIELASQEFTNFEAIAKIFSQYKREGLIAAEITPSFALIGRRREAANLASLNGIALVAHRLEWAEAGAVLTYGSDVGEAHRRAARMADRVLKGAKPADIPVEMVSRFELAVNTRAATALGMHIPQAVLKRADKVFT